MYANLNINRLQLTMVECTWHRCRVRENRKGNEVNFYYDSEVRRGERTVKMCAHG